MSEITKAIAARHAQIKQLQADIDALQRAASVLGGKTTAKATRQPKTKSKPKAKPQSTLKPKPKAKKRHQWSAAEKAAIGKRMKAYWAKRKRAKG